MGMPPVQGIKWRPGLAGHDGSKWPQGNKNWNPPKRGYKWLGAIAANGLSAIKIGIPQSGATNGGRDWLGTMAANGLIARKNFPWHEASKAAAASQQSAKADGGKWPQRDKNRNSPKQGDKWWPEFSGRDGSEWPQGKKKLCPGARHQQALA